MGIERKPSLAGWRARIDDRGWPEMALNHGDFVRLESVRHDASARALRFRFVGEDREYTLSEFAPDYQAVMAVLAPASPDEGSLAGSLDALVKRT